MMKVFKAMTRHNAATKPQYSAKLLGRWKRKAGMSADSRGQNARRGFAAVCTEVLAHAGHLLERVLLPAQQPVRVPVYVKENRDQPQQRGINLGGGRD